MFNLKVLSLY